MTVQFTTRAQLDNVLNSLFEKRQKISTCEKLDYASATRQKNKLSIENELDKKNIEVPTRKKKCSVSF